MKAITYSRYGSPDVLRLEEVPTPQPKAGEVLVQVHAASVNKGDWHLMRGEPFLVRLVFGLRKPKLGILGSDMAGRVVGSGEGAERFELGDAVFGCLDDSGFGGFAEFVCVKESALARKPAGISFAEAAAVPQAATTALQGLRNHGRIAAGQRVLIHGASGGVGSFAVQLAKALGAEVTAVGGTEKQEFLHTLGADHVIDYTREDCTQGESRYDLVLDAAAYRAIRDFKRILKPGGAYIMAGGSGRSLLQIMTLGPLFSAFGKVRMRNYLVAPNLEDLEFLCGLLEAASVTPRIDCCFPLEECAEALRLLEARRVEGKYIIGIKDADTL